MKGSKIDLFYKDFNQFMSNDFLVLRNAFLYNQYPSLKNEILSGFQKIFSEVFLFFIDNLKMNYKITQLEVVFAKILESLSEDHFKHVCWIQSAKEVKSKTEVEKLLKKKFKNEEIIFIYDIDKNIDFKVFFDYKIYDLGRKNFIDSLKIKFMQSIKEC